jgi:CMP-N-acetylneuraminic acid synthetase
VKFLAVIPARSGSKTIKKKNLCLINKKPLVQYTFEELKKSKLKEKYLLSDDLKIKNLAKKFNINTTYYRPKKVSKNTSSLIALLNDFHKWTENKKIFYDYMVVLQPTSPLRDHKDINNAVKIIKKKKYKSLFSISKSLEHPYETIKFKKKNEWKHVLSKSRLYYRRQDFDFESFFMNGAIYIIHRELVIKKKIYDNISHSFFYMPKYKSLEINDLDELKIVEALIKQNEN